MKELKLAPGDNMVCSNEEDNDSLLYIKEGSVSVSVTIGNKRKIIYVAQVLLLILFRFFFYI